MSIGYEWELTPLQILNFYNTVANDGVMMKPFLVSEIRDRQDVIQKFKPTVIDHSIASSATIDKAQLLLKGVVERGTGKKLRSEYLTFAGKTGTSQIDYFIPGARKKHQSSFAGYFPADNPKYSCIVLVRNPRRNGYYGSVVAGPVFKEIAERCFGMENLRQQYAAVEDQMKYVQSVKLPNYQVGYKNDVKSILRQAQVSYEDLTEGDWALVLGDDDRIMLKTRAVTHKEIPDVVNMSLRDALYVLENRGLKTAINGSGRVVKQSIPPGEKIDGQTIALTLQ
jgi:cell division protein FtsI (penicillin-binding protein 3)